MAETAMQVEVRVLGDFAILCDGAVALDASWRPAKAGAIVKILALQHKHSIHRDRLIDMLWPDADEVSGPNNLYKNLHQLRSELKAGGTPPDFIRLEGGVLALDPAVTVDADEFRRAAAACRGDAGDEALAAALRLYHGDLLPDDLYDEWTEPLRDELRIRALLLRLQLAERRLADGRYQDAIDEFNQVLMADPTSEAAHRGLMEAFARSGQRDLALRQYEKCCEILKRDLHAAPSDETDALAGQIRDQGGPRGTDAPRAERKSVSLKAALVVLQPKTLTRRIEISPGTLKIGREDDNDIVLDSPRVSRYHARVTWDDPRYAIEDLASRNGTWVNGARIEGPVTLDDGDFIRVGDITLMFELQGQRTVTMSTRPAERPNPDED